MVKFCALQARQRNLSLQSTVLAQLLKFAMSSNSGFSATPPCDADTYNKWQSSFTASYVKTNPTKLSEADKLESSKHRYSYMYWSCSA
jgi:hypothetical protein